MIRTGFPAWREMAMALAFVALALIGHHAYIQAVQPDVPYMDSMRMLVFQQAWRDGTMSLYDLWEPGSAHHGLIGQMLLWANVALFDLDAKLANLATGWVIAVVCLVVARAFLLDRRGPRPIDAKAPGSLPLALALALLVMLLFSWAGFELLTLELGLSLWLKNLCFIGFFLAHQAWLRKPAPDARSGVALAAFGVATVLLIGQGWSYGLTAAVIATQALAWMAGPRDRAGAALLRWLPALALLLSLVAYTMAGTHKGDPSARMPLAASSVLLPLYSFGSAWVGSEPFLKTLGSAWALLVAGAITVLVGAWALYRRWRRGIASGSLLPVYFMAYAATCAAMYAVARGGWGIHGVIAPRYYLDLVLFPIGVLWLLFEDAEMRRDGWARASGIACVALAAVLVAGHAWTYRVEWKTAPYRAMAFDRMEEAFRRGAATPDDSRLIQAPQPYAAEAAAIMRARRLSVFARLDAEECSDAAMRYLGGWYPQEKQNRWMQQVARIEVPPCGCEAKANVYIPPGFPARELVVDAAGTSTSVSLRPGGLATLSLPAAPFWRTATLRVSHATVPVKDFPGSPDRRTLGALLGPLAFACPTGR